MDPWSLTTILITFGGGVMGTAFGGLFSIVLCALLALVGCVMIMMGGSDFLLFQVALGPVFGPHVGGFGAGLCAAAYAAGVKKNHPGGSAKDILSPLVDTSWDVLAMGGVFAVFAHILAQGIAQVPILNQSDTLAMNLVLTCVIARFIFFKGEMPWGQKESIQKYGLLGTDNGNLSWMPWQSKPARLLMLGIGMGTLSPGLAMMIQQQLAPMVAAGTISAADSFTVCLIMGWTLGIIALIPLNLGQGSVQKVPITHCIAELSAVAFLLTGSFIFAAIIGIVAAFWEELWARLIWNHGSTHIDPPATAIAFGVMILSLLLKPEFLNLAQFFK